MANIIKNFKMFLEGYSEELSEVLSNEENNFVLSNGDKILVGTEILEDSFTFLGEILEGEGLIEDVYEFNELVSELSINDEMDQYEVDDALRIILDRFEIIEPYKIQLRSELEETPIEMEDPEYDEGLEPGEEGYDEFEDLLLGESVSSDPFCIVGDINGNTEEIDSFISSEEADSYLPEYKTIYNEYENIKVIHRDLLESKSSCNCKDGKCDCGDDCNCGDDCSCSECKGSSKVNESSYTDLTIDDFIKIKKEASDIVMDAGSSMESWLMGFYDQIENGTLSEGDIELLRNSLEQYDLDLDELIDDLKSDNIDDSIDDSIDDVYTDSYDEHYENIKSFKDFIG